MSLQLSDFPVQANPLESVLYPGIKGELVTGTPVTHSVPLSRRLLDFCCCCSFLILTQRSFKAVLYPLFPIPALPREEEE